MKKYWATLIRTAGFLELVCEHRYGKILIKQLLFVKMSEMV
jgi:hypothetical protein